jgi:glycosyltransferase 2 family protein
MSVKIALSLAILGYLVYRAANGKDPAETAQKREALKVIFSAPKDWSMLVAGFLAMLTAVVITMVRWWYLVRALGIDFALAPALRISFLGYLFNFAPTGIAGGDLLKAWMLSKEHPGNRAKSLASVVVDRIIGLYVLFLVAAAGIFFTGLWHYADPRVHGICVAELAVTGGSTLGIALVLIPGFLESPFVQFFTRIPKVGRAVASLLEAITIYREKRVVLLWTSVMTIPVHILLTFSLFLLAMGLRFHSQEVAWRDYFAIYPMGSIAQTIPLPAGPTELVMKFFYTAIWQNQSVPEATLKMAELQGLILAVAFRVCTFLIIPISVVYYFWGARSEVKDVMHEIEEEESHATAQPID